jgi:hypothetical protein
LTYLAPVGWLLRGVYGETSGVLKNHLYVHSLYMPLYVPSEHIVLSYGERASAASLEELAPEVKRALQEIPDERKGLRRIAAYDFEEGRYAFLLSGQTEKAARALRRPYAPEDGRAFVDEARQRISLISSLLDGDGATAAIRQLRAWRGQTLQALGIE